MRLECPVAYTGGLPDSAAAVTLSKMCGSAMKAAMLLHDLPLAGATEVMVAGGMESMANALGWDSLVSGLSGPIPPAQRGGSGTGQEMR